VRGSSRDPQLPFGPPTLEGMDNRAEVRDFLMSRREKVTPEQAGLPVYGTRRVNGLRRNEVATLAGVSVEYYTRLERGNLQGVSDSVLESVARALQLDDLERTHLFDLARAANASPARLSRGAKPARPVVRPSVARIIEKMPELPAFVQNDTFDILLANPLGRALYSELYDDPAAHENTARFVFLSPAARRFYLDWEQVARGAVGTFRVRAGRNPYDRELSNLIGELSTRSDAFRIMWGANDVHLFREGTKRFNHPVVGELALEHESMDVPGDDGLAVTVYSAPPGSAAGEKLGLLASYAATPAEERHTSTGAAAAPRDETQA
jgi:transcriptional regulator with XRE-family HTH domain